MNKYLTTSLYPLIRGMQLLLITMLPACQQTSPETTETQTPYQKREIAYDEQLKPFYHGVASGDPLHDRVMIWTRVTPEQISSVEVTWQVSRDSSFADIVREGRVTTSADQDFTVKVDVDSLRPDQVYFYRFNALEATSGIGKTKTAPDQEQDRLRFAFASCSNYEFGFFNAYGHIAAQPVYDAVVHLGDYIYEYGVGTYGDTARYGRLNVPAHEIVSLEDYRTRYDLYRADPELQAAHAAHPWITIWDDHEISNNAYKEGAENHDPETEGDYAARREAAVQAYYEWMPVRGKAGDPLYRSFHFGPLADLMVLDGRLAGRSAPADTVALQALMDSSRTMLGPTQREWLESELKASSAQWKIIGNQVIFSGLDASQLKRTPDKFLDMWDGYAAERAELIKFLKENNITNLIIGTGDFHSSMALEIPDDPLNPATYRRDDSSQQLGVEFVVHSVNASNVNEWVGQDTARIIEKIYQEATYNPHVRHANMSDHGYVELLLDREKATMIWKYLETLEERNYRLKDSVVLYNLKGSARLTPAPAVR